MEVEGSSAAEKDEKQDVGFQKGDILGGLVAGVNPGVGGLSVQIAPGVFGSVHVTHLSDSWRDDPMATFKVGQFVWCAVLEVVESSNSKPHIDLTLRKSLGGSDVGADIPGSSEFVKVESICDLKEDLEVQGFVMSATSVGCFASLAFFHFKTAHSSVESGRDKENFHLHLQM